MVEGGEEGVIVTYRTPESHDILVTLNFIFWWSYTFMLVAI